MAPAGAMQKASGTAARAKAKGRSSIAPGQRSGSPKKRKSEINTEDDRSAWTSLRLEVAHIIEHRLANVVVGFIIFFNIIVVVFETNGNVDCQQVTCSGPLLQALGHFFVLLYTLELAVHVFVYRLQLLCNVWDLVDIFIVCVGILDSVLQALSKEDLLPEVAMLKMLRMLRLARAARLLRLFPTLASIFRGFFVVMQAMFWGGITIMGLLLMFAIFAVEVVHPWNSVLEHDNDWCAQAFSSVQLAFLFFFQNAVVGDSSCVLELILERWYLFPLFVFVFAVVQMGLMNLILSAIVDEANQAQQEDMETKLREMKAEEKEMMADMGKVFKDIDRDGTGDVTIEEILRFYDRDSRLQHTLKLLGIDRGALNELFHMIDADGSGAVGKDEFVRAMCDTHAQDVKMQIMKMKLQLSQVERSLSQEMNDLGAHLQAAAKHLSTLNAAPEMKFHAPVAGPGASISDMNKAVGDGEGEVSGIASAESTSAVGYHLVAAFEKELEAFRKGLRSQLAALADRPVEARQLFSQGQDSRRRLFIGDRDQEGLKMKRNGRPRWKHLASNQSRGRDEQL